MLLADRLTTAPFAHGARDVCLGRRKPDVLGPGMAGMRGESMVVSLRLCMK